MSSPKKIGRWYRFEIAFAQDERSRERLCREAWASTLDKKRDLRKMEKKTAGSATASPKKTPNEETATSVKTVFSRTASASLWTEARRWAERAEERGESELEFERPENSASEEGKRALPPRRSRTFRADEPSRRFDDSSDA